MNVGYESGAWVKRNWKSGCNKQGKCWWEQIILGHIKRSWIYPKVNEGFEARVGKKLQEPVNISKSYSIQSSMNWRLKDWKLNEQLEVAPGRKWWFPGPGWWFWRRSIPGLIQEWGSWAGQGLLCTDMSLYLEICSKTSTISGAQICMILIYEFVLSQKSLIQNYFFYTKSKNIKVEWTSSWQLKSLSSLVIQIPGAWCPLGESWNLPGPQFHHL